MSRSSITPAQTISISDVARHADVSVATVSNILNGTGSVREDTRRRVLKSVNKLGYRRLRARRASPVTTRTFAYVTGFRQRSVQDAFDVEFMRGLSRAVEKHEARLQVLTVQNETDPDAVRIDGIDGLIMRPHASDVFKALAERLPAVALGSYSVDMPITAIEADNVGATRQLVNHLHDQGHRRFGYVTWDLRNTSYCDRYWTMRDTLRKLDLPFNEQWLMIGKDARSVADRLAKTDDRPTAIVCCNDSCALELMSCLEDTPLHVPHDLALTGFDNLPAGLTARPKLTTVDTRREYRAELAVLHLIDRLEGRVATPLRINVPSEVIIRDSSTTSV